MNLHERLDAARKELHDLLDRAPTGVRRGHWSADISLAQYKVEKLEAQLAEQKDKVR